MKSINAFFALVLAASFTSTSFAAPETTPPLIKVPKNEAAMQATRETIAKDAANNPVKPAAHKAAKPATHQPKAKQGKAAPAKKQKAKAHVAKK